MITLVIFVPIYDRLIVSQLRRITGKEGGISLLQRIVNCFSFTCFSFSGGEKTESCTYETYIRLTLAGFAESFTAIGLVEFYYKQFPENMRSVVGAFFFCGMAASSYLSGFLVTIIHRTTERAATGNWMPEDLNKGRLVYFYFLITTLGIVNLGGYFKLV